MKAIVQERYGAPEVLQLREVEKPAPQDDQVLIRVHAATVTAYDVRARAVKVPSPIFYLPARMTFGLMRPKQSIPGDEFAGQIEAVGKAVDGYQVGDRVFGFPGAAGGYADYLCRRPGRGMAMAPDNMTYEEAAAIPFGGVTALYFLRDLAKLRPGQQVLINGASGGVGTASVQLAKHYGAQVTGVCSTANLDLVRSLGADQVIDYTAEDFTKHGETYDVIFDTVGTTSFSRAKRALKPNGLYLNAVIGLTLFAQQWWTGRRDGRRAMTGIAPVRAGDLDFLRELVEAGEYRTHIDRRYPLDQVAEAHRYVEQGHKRGNVVITVNHRQRS